MKNILISSSSETDGGSGISTYAKEIAVCLIGKGYSVHFISPTPEDFSWINENNIKHLPSDRMASQKDSCIRAYNYIIENNIEGIINNDNPVITSLSPALTCPVISVGHLEKFSIAGLVSFNSDWMDYIVAISNDMKLSYTRRFNIPVEKCPVVHNGLSKMTETVEYSNNKKLKLIFTGEFSKRKGADHIVNMIKSKHPIWSNVELHWFGNLPDKIINSVSHNKNFVNHGRVPRDVLLSELRSCDIFLMASRDEGCPMSMLEAMSFGIVPITSNGKGAMQWLIDHGIHGYVCDLRDWHLQALSCIQLLANNRKILNRMKTAVLDHFNSNHLVDHTTDQLLNLLQNPTVDRNKRSTCIEVLQWHRKRNSNFIQKIYWRLGHLEKETDLELTDVVNHL